MLDIILDLAHIFRAANRQLYMVGGTVRDLLLNRASSPDIDLATDARPDEIKRLVAKTRPAAIVTVGEQFGTVRVHYQAEMRQPTTEHAESTERQREGKEEGRSAQDSAPASNPSSSGSASEDSVVSVVYSGSGSPEPVAVVAQTPAGIEIVEITTYRSDQYSRESRKPEVTFGDTLDGDLMRRDFTINAMARDPLTGEIIDPFGGREDLQGRLIRAVGDDPERRFDEDPLRMLRACRFAAQLDFQIEEHTAAAIKRQAGTLAKISRERIRDEFTKLLVSPNPMRGLRLAVNLGLMPYIVPEVLELRGVSQAPAHSKDVYEHVLRVVQRIPPRPAARWAAVLHDIAKPRTKSIEEGRVHFFGHEDVGAVMAREILRRLKFDRPFIDHVVLLVKMHMRANAYSPDWTDGAVRRLMLEADGALQDLLALSRADITSYRPDKVLRAEARVDELDARCVWLREEAERVPLKSPLDGNELMALFARPPGAWIRPIKDYLLDLVIDGQLAPDDKETAIALAQAKMRELEAQGMVAPPEASQAEGQAEGQGEGQPEGEAKRPQQVPPAQRRTESAPPTTPTGPGANREGAERKRAARAAAKRQSRAALTTTPSSATVSESTEAGGEHEGSRGREGQPRREDVSGEGPPGRSSESSRPHSPPRRS